MKCAKQRATEKTLNDINNTTPFRMHLVLSALTPNMNQGKRQHLDVTHAELLMHSLIAGNLADNEQHTASRPAG